MQRFHSCFLFLFVLLLPGMLPAETTKPAQWPGYQQSPWFAEQYRYLSPEPEVRAIIVAPAPGDINSTKPTRVVFFATPNGNTIEQTLGCRPKEGRHWHFQIQQIAAQHREWRSKHVDENLILVCLEAKGLSWPGWRGRHRDNPKRIRAIMESILNEIPVTEPCLTLACHSGGGSFLWGFLNGSETIPANVDRFVFLDANYSFETADRHGTKLLTWLKGDPERRLILLAYDDRNVLFRGKKVVSPTGGTFRATYRMRDRFKQELTFTERKKDDFAISTALDNRLCLLIHLNPKNQILHTRLVGEMNGYRFAMSLQQQSGEVIQVPQAPPTYTRWIQPDPFEQPVTVGEP